jgi:hypothetical protein
MFRQDALGAFGDIMAISKRVAQARAFGAAAAGALALTAVSPAIGATAADLFYERAVMVAADGDCHLFQPDVSSALSASLVQARGAALRSGADMASLDEIAGRASEVAAHAGCASPDIAVAANRVRAGFAGYAHMPRMDFPGDLESWSAERPLPSSTMHWRASQRDRFGWDLMQFGIADQGDARPLVAVASFADGARPYGARLVIRDASITSGPYLDARQADISGRIPIAGRLPPRSASRVFTAEEMTAASSDLAGADLAGGWAFRFPEAATDALAALDPREAVAVEFLFPGDGGETVRTAYVEVGDFASARAFQALAQR